MYVYNVCVSRFLFMSVGVHVQEYMCVREYLTLVGEPPLVNRVCPYVQVKCSKEVPKISTWLKS